MKRILEGIRVLDVGTFVFGPATATVLSDFGADVIKVEPPKTGDPYRYLHEMPPLPACEQDYCWLLDGRNKRSIVLDLRQAKAREILYALVRESDVFVTNYQPSVLRALGITWNEIRPLNERLVYAEATGYGDRGSEVEKPGYDASAWWARSGLMDVVRPEGGDPGMPAPAMGDHPSAMALFGAIMMALYRRERTGQGGRVTSSLMANGMWANGVYAQAMLCGSEPFRHVRYDEPPNAVVHGYRTRDGRWLLLLLVREDADWDRFAEAIGLPELARDSRFGTTADRRKNSRELSAILAEHFRTRDFAEWAERLDRGRITYGVGSRLEDLPEDPQMEANEVLVPIEDGGGLRTVSSPIWLDGETKVPPRRAPEMGAHTDAVLSGLGYDAAAIRRLRENGAIG